MEVASDDDAGASNQHDIITYTPHVSKNISQTEYFLLDQSMMTFVDKLSTDDFTEQALEVAVSKCCGNHSQKTKKLNDFAKSFCVDQKYRIDRIYYHIIMALRDNPQPVSSLLEHPEIAAAGVNEQQLLEYIKRLETIGIAKRTWDIISEEAHKRIIEILAKKAMTLKEICIEYNKIQPERSQKSENTIYRYIKLLQLAKLVVLAGQRVTEDKTASETLYSIAAYIYFIPEYETKIWKSEFGGKVAMLMEKIFQLSNLKEQNVNADKIKFALENIQNCLDKQTRAIIEGTQEEIVKSLSDYSMHEINVAFRNAGMLAWLLTDSDRIQEILSVLR